MREVLWERLRRTEIEQAAKAGAVAIIPVASLEQHANHLPVNTDSNIVSTIAERAARAIEGGAGAGPAPHLDRLLAPPHGLSGERHAEVPHLRGRADTGGGERACPRVPQDSPSERPRGELRHRGRHATKLLEEDGVSTVGYDYWNLPPMLEAMRRLCTTDKGFVDHAGEFETSVQMYLQSELVETGATVWAPGAFGDPSAATADKGRGLIEAAVEALVRLLRAYHNGEVEEQLRWRKEAPE